MNENYDEVQRELDKMLFCSIFSRNLEMVKSLVMAEADVNAKNEDGISILMTAIFVGDFKTVEFLVEAGAAFNATYKNGTTPLELATYMGDTKIISFLRGKRRESKELSIKPVVTELIMTA